MRDLLKSLRHSGLVLASHNPGKVREIEALVAPLGIAVQSAAALGLAEPEENGTTFGENAAIKAIAASRACQKPALSDDSGLEVMALDGAPGIYSARWAGPNKDFSLAMAKVESSLAGKTDRRARFVCVLCLAFPDGALQTFFGAIDGELVFPPRGEQGFGYDPIFVAHGEDLTFGEMDPVQKHAMSHRTKAFEKFLDALDPSGSKLMAPDQGQ